MQEKERYIRYRYRERRGEKRREKRREAHVKPK
jgi:hypothetical protein